MTVRRNIIVTGGASGIGAAAARRLAGAGCAVTIADRDEGLGRELAASLAAQDRAVRFVAMDVTDAASVRAAVEAAVAAFGPLDGAINSAGVPQPGAPLHELEDADWDGCVDINLRGMFLCLKHQVRAMLDRGGAIVAVSSAAAVKGLINSSAYCASKAGILGLIRSGAADYASRGVRINAILPGATATPLATRSSAANPKLAQTLSVPIGRMADPDEVAAAAVWLISPDASYVTGAALAVDGAMTL